MLMMTQNNMRLYFLASFKGIFCLKMKYFKKNRKLVNHV